MIKPDYLFETLNTKHRAFTTINMPANMSSLRLMTLEALLIPPLVR